MSIRQTKEEWDALSPAQKLAAVAQARLEHIGMTGTINNPEEPVFRTSKYFDASRDSSNTTTRTVAANTLGAYPLYVRTGVTIDQLMFNVQTAGAVSSTGRIGLYTLGPTFFPGTLLLDSGTLATDAIATLTYNFPTHLSLPAGWVAVAYNFSDVPVLRALSRTGVVTVPEADNTFPGTRNNSWAFNTAYAALPSVFPSSAFATPIDVPQVIFRVV
jgi:hypothetical protein